MTIVINRSANAQTQQSRNAGGVNWSNRNNAARPASWYQNQTVSHGRILKVTSVHQPAEEGSEPVQKVLYAIAVGGIREEQQQRTGNIRAACTWMAIAWTKDQPSEEVLESELTLISEGMDSQGNQIFVDTGRYYEAHEFRGTGSGDPIEDNMVRLALYVKPNTQVDTLVELKLADAPGNKDLSSMEEPPF